MSNNIAPINDEFSKIFDEICEERFAGLTISTALGAFAAWAGQLGLGVTIYWNGIIGTMIISDRAGEHTKDFVKDLWDKAFGAGNHPKDPIILDLNGDGIKTTTIVNGAFFDYENDGFAESTAWVEANEG